MPNYDDYSTIAVVAAGVVVIAGSVCTASMYSIAASSDNSKGSSSLSLPPLSNTSFRDKWYIYFDKSYQREYYHNRDTGVTSWVKPTGENEFFVMETNVKDFCTVSEPSLSSSLLQSTTFQYSILSACGITFLGGGFYMGLRRQKRQHSFSPRVEKSKTSKHVGLRTTGRITGTSISNATKTAAMTSAMKAFAYATVIAVGGMGILVGGVAYSTESSSFKEFGMYAKNVLKPIGSSLSKVYSTSVERDRKKEDEEIYKQVKLEMKIAEEMYERKHTKS